MHQLFHARSAHQFAIKPSVLAMSSVLLATVSPLALHAQEQTTPPSASVVEEVVVTGTLIRGIQPTGSQVLGISTEQIKATGAAGSSELLGSLPQASNLFNQRTTIAPGAGSQVQVVRPNLRNLPGGSLATGAATLILVDGHRVPGVGVKQVATDPDMIPPAVIERVEIITDGGSSIYGSDAIGGVINFVTKRRFEGVQLDAGYSIADDFTSYDTNLTAGTAWDTGSVYVSYSYADQDEVLNKDRDWAKSIYWDTGLGFDNACAQPTVNVGGTLYAAPGFAPNTVNSCDNGQKSAFSPAMDREAVFANYSQDFGESVTLDIKAFYSERKTSASSGPLDATGRMESQNPYYIDMNGTGAPQSVLFNFEPYSGIGEEETGFKSWGITPELKVDLFSDWQMRALLNYGKSESDYFTPQTNTSLLTAYGQGSTTATAVNYYDINSTANKQLLDNILNWALIGEAEDEIWNVRAIFDGSLFSIAGGDVRLALGLEYFEEEYSRREGLLAPADFSSQEWQSYDRDISSVFGELQIPIVGSGNRFTGVESFELSVSVRHDDYSDFGTTTNPKFGFSYMPVGWATIRGSWGESFNAPTAVDQLSSQFNSISVFPSFVVPNPNDPPTPGSASIAVQGAAPDLVPQTAETWSLGVEIEPPALEGFRANINYYEIDFEGTLGKPPVFNPSQAYTNFPEYLVMHPTPDQIQEAGTYAIGGDAVVAPFLLPGAQEVYNIIYFVTDNLGNTRIKGLDLELTQYLDAGFGTVDFGLAGNFRLESETQDNENSPWRDDLEYDEPEYFLKASAGTTVGGLRAQVSWNYTDGYDVVRLPNRSQDHVGSFQTVDMFFRYELSGGGWQEDLAFSLNVNNVLDREPPIYRQDGSDGYTNGFTLGRLYKFGVSKKF